MISSSFVTYQVLRCSDDQNRPITFSFFVCSSLTGFGLGFSHIFDVLVSHVFVGGIVVVVVVVAAAFTDVQPFCRFFAQTFLESFVERADQRVHPNIAAELNRVRKRQKRIRTHVSRVEILAWPQSQIQLLMMVVVVVCLMFNILIYR